VRDSSACVKAPSELSEEIYGKWTQGT